MTRYLIAVLLIATACSANKPVSPPPPTRTPTPTSVDLDPQLRPGTKLVRQIQADMNGDGSDEIAVWSQATSAPRGSVLNQSYVDLFTDESGSWHKIFTASGALTVDAKYVSQQLQFFQFVKFQSKPDLVLGVLNEGASAGPLDVWVFDGLPPATAFRYSTTVDGQLAVDGNRLELDTGSYKPSDPMCCPSGMDHIAIGSQNGKIAIVSKTTTKS